MAFVRAFSAIALSLIILTMAKYGELKDMENKSLLGFKFQANGDLNYSKDSARAVGKVRIANPKERRLLAVVLDYLHNNKPFSNVYQKASSRKSRLSDKKQRGTLESKLRAGFSDGSSDKLRGGKSSAKNNRHIVQGNAYMDVKAWKGKSIPESGGHSARGSRRNRLKNLKMAEFEIGEYGDIKSATSNTNMQKYGGYKRNIFANSHQQIVSEAPKIKPLEQNVYKKSISSADSTNTMNLKISGFINSDGMVSDPIIKSTNGIKGRVEYDEFSSNYDTQLQNSNSMENTAEENKYGTSEFLVDSKDKHGMGNLEYIRSNNSDASNTFETKSSKLRVKQPLEHYKIDSRNQNLANEGLDSNVIENSDKYANSGNDKQMKEFKTKKMDGDLDLTTFESNKLEDQQSKHVRNKFGDSNAIVSETNNTEAKDYVSAKDSEGNKDHKALELNKLEDVHQNNDSKYTFNKFGKNNSIESKHSYVTNELIDHKLSPNANSSAEVKINMNENKLESNEFENDNKDEKSKRLDNNNESKLDIGKISAEEIRKLKPSIERRTALLEPNWHDALVNSPYSNVKNRENNLERQKNLWRKFHQFENNYQTGSKNQNIKEEPKHSHETLKSSLDTSEDISVDIVESTIQDVPNTQSKASDSQKRKRWYKYERHGNRFETGRNKQNVERQTTEQKLHKTQVNSLKYKKDSQLNNFKTAEKENIDKLSVLPPRLPKRQSIKWSKYDRLNKNFEDRSELRNSQRRAEDPNSENDRLRKTEIDDFDTLIKSISEAAKREHNRRQQVEELRRHHLETLKPNAMVKATDVENTPESVDEPNNLGIVWRHGEPNLFDKTHGTVADVYGSGKVKSRRCKRSPASVDLSLKPAINFLKNVGKGTRKRCTRQTTLGEQYKCIFCSKKSAAWDKFLKCFELMPKKIRTSFGSSLMDALKSSENNKEKDFRKLLCHKEYKLKKIFKKMAQITTAANCFSNIYKKYCCN